MLRARTPGAIPNTLPASTDTRLHWYAQVGLFRPLRFHVWDRPPCICWRDERAAACRALNALSDGSFKKLIRLNYKEAPSLTLSRQCLSRRLTMARCLYLPERRSAQTPEPRPSDCFDGRTQQHHPLSAPVNSLMVCGPRGGTGSMLGVSADNKHLRHRRR